MLAVLCIPSLLCFFTGSTEDSPSIKNQFNEVLYLTFQRRCFSVIWMKLCLFCSYYSRTNNVVVCIDWLWITKCKVAACTCSVLCLNYNLNKWINCFCSVLLILYLAVWGEKSQVIKVENTAGGIKIMKIVLSTWSHLNHCVFQNRSGKILSMSKFKGIQSWIENELSLKIFVFLVAKHVSLYYIIRLGCIFNKLQYLGKTL